MVPGISFVKDIIVSTEFSDVVLNLPKRLSRAGGSALTIDVRANEAID